MATIVEYNGVTLYNVLTRRWDEEVVYDSTGTDEIGKKYSFVFQGVLHQQRVPLTNAEVFVSSGDTAVDTGVVGADVFALLEYVKRVLNKPRATLRIKFGTYLVNDLALEIVPATVAGESGSLPPNADIENGPKPRVISVVPIGSKAFRITFAIEATTGTCVGKTRDADTMVLSNRWSVAESMDDNFFTTRRITGQLKLAAGLFGAGTSPSGATLTNGFPGHAYKHLTIPPLESGFKREGITFNCTADGLTCTYEIIDRQVHTAAPWPATRIEGTHTEATSYGTFFSSEMHVRLTGDPACNKRLLIERAVQILDDRLALSIIADFAQAWVESFSITDHIGELPVIEASARLNRTALIGPDANGGRDPNDFWQQLGRRLYLPPISVESGEVTNTNYDDQLSRVPWWYGYNKNEPGPDHERRPAVLFFLHCYLQNSCANTHDVGPGEAQPDEGPSNEDGSPRSETPPVYEDPEGTSPPYKPDSETYSEATKANIYTTAEVSTEYETDTGIVGLPLASVANAGAYSSSLPASPIYGAPGRFRANTTEFIYTYAPQTWRIHRVNLERIGSQPQIPDPVSHYVFGDTVGVLKRFKTEILAPIRSPDGNHQVHRTLATYVFLLDKPPRYDLPLPVGINPVTAFPNFTGAIQLNRTGSLGTGSATAASGPQSG